MADKTDRQWTEAGDVALRMYLEDEVSVEKIAEDLKRKEDDVRDRIEMLRSEGKLDTVDFNKIEM